MTSEQRRRDDRKRHVQFVFASLGAAAVIGSMLGAAFAGLMTLVRVMDDAEQDR